MSDENGQATDLLGDPWTEARDPRGRKRHRRLPQIAEKVAVLRASDLTVEEIAARVGLSEPTLRRYYFRELKSGPALAKSLIVEAMYAKAKAGNVSAARFIREEFSRGETAVPVAREPKPQPATDLGKKAQADLDAQTAHEGTGWGELLN